MRLPFALTLALLMTLPLFSGCAEPLEDPTTADVDAAAAAVDAAVDDLANQAGHIAGTVTDEAGAALAGAHVELDGAKAVDTDAQGLFGFVDVPAGEHKLNVRLDGFEEALDVAVPVTAQAISRPDIILVESKPDPYLEVTHFTAFTDLDTLGFGGIGCWCDFQVPLAEGATAAILEVVDEQGFNLAGDYQYWVDSSATDDNGTAYLASDYGYLYDMDRIHLAPDLFAGADLLSVHVEPDTLAVEDVYDVYLTVFYNGEAPEEYTAVAG